MRQSELFPAAPALETWTPPAAAFVATREGRVRFLGEFQTPDEAFLSGGAGLELNALHCSCEGKCRCGSLYE